MRACVQSPELTSKQRRKTRRDGTCLWYLEWRDRDRRMPGTTGPASTANQWAPAPSERQCPRNKVDVTEEDTSDWYLEHTYTYTHSCTHMYTTHMHSHTYINTHVVQKLPSFTCPQRWGLNDVLKCLSLFIAWGRHGTHTYWRTTFFEAISGTFLWILLLEWPPVTCLSNALNMSPDSLGADCHLVVYSDILFVF